MLTQFMTITKYLSKNCFLIFLVTQLYNECDNFGTDVVRTTTLIERLSLMVGSNPHVDKTLLKYLSILLDPRGDDGYLKKEEFVEIGLKVIL